MGIDLFHLLGHETKLRGALRVEFFLVMEGDRFECQNRFTGLVYRFDIVLKTR